MSGADTAVRADRPAFCNGVWEIVTALSPRRLQVQERLSPPREVSASPRPGS